MGEIAAGVGRMSRGQSQIAMPKRSNGRVHRIQNDGHQDDANNHLYVSMADSGSTSG